MYMLWTSNAGWRALAMPIGMFIHWTANHLPNLEYQLAYIPTGNEE